MSLGSNSGQQQQFRCPDGAGGQDDIAARLDQLLLSVVFDDNASRLTTGKDNLRNNIQLVLYTAALNSKN